MKLVNTHIQYILLALTMSVWNIGIAQTWSLQQCIDTALVHNKNLQIGRNNILIGEQKAIEAKANLIPKLIANAEYKYFTNLPYQLMPLSTFNPAAPEGQFKEAQFGVPHNINVNLQLAIPLYNPQIYGGIEATKIATEMSELQYQKSAEQIYFEISNLYYNAQIVHHQLAFVDSNLVNAERLLKNIALLKEQLLAKGTDVSKVKLQVSQLNTQKVSIGSRYAQIINALKFAMGVSMEVNIQIAPNIQYQNPEEYASSTTLDIRIAKTQNSLIKSELKTLHRSRYLPTLNVIGSYGTTGMGYDKRPNNFIKFYPIGFVGVQLSYPLFNGTVTLRKIKQKNLELQSNALQFDILTEQNNMQIENTKLEKIVKQQSIETTNEQIKLAQTIYNQTIIQQKQGTASLTDVLLADNALREAQQTYLSTIIDFLKADLELKKLTGNITPIK